MSNLRRIFIYLSIITIILSLFIAQAKAAENFIINESLTVNDIIVDKTDTNAVTARSRAMVEARRSAFKKLAQSSMSADVFMKYKIPKDKVINSLIKDFEIKEERFSNNRYVANFTFRFNKKAAYLIRVAGGDLTSYDVVNIKNMGIKANDRDFIDWSGTKKVSVLLLPYYKNFFGRNILWEDPNPWREAWQYFGKLKTISGVSIVIPTGDINDIILGDSDSIWRGEPDVIEALKKKYKVNQVVLAIAEDKDSNIDVNIYSYNDSEFRYKKTIEPFNKSNNIKIDLWRLINKMVTDKSLFKGVINFKNKKQYLKKIKPVILKITMSFTSFKEWMDAQKLITSVKGNPKIDILSLSRGSVKFRINLESETSFNNLKEEFFNKGIMLIPANTEYGDDDNADIIIHRYILRIN